jgi:hypothetical protein
MHTLQRIEQLELLPFLGKWFAGSAPALFLLEHPGGAPAPEARP